MKQLVHCSYHKCLTVYYGKVASALFNRLSLNGANYRHFNSRLDDFWAEYGRFRLSSVNNHALELARLGPDFRVTRFIRDPRDLVVSGYFYHKRGAEKWCHVVDPTERDWVNVNGALPTGMPAGESLTSYLNKLDEEDGLIAEIDFRRAHFDGMRQWPKDDRIKLYKYEEIMGNEPDVFADMFAFYGAGYPRVALSRIFAKRYSAGSGKVGAHVRDAKPQQWKSRFTKKVNDYFEARYADVLEMYGYS